MPKCNKKIVKDGKEIGSCGYMLPPDFVDKLGEHEYICHYCLEGKNALVGTDGILYKKDDVVEDYKNLIDKLASSEKLKETILNQKITQGMKNVNN